MDFLPQPLITSDLMVREAGSSSLDQIKPQRDQLIMPQAHNLEFKNSRTLNSIFIESLLPPFSSHQQSHSPYPIQKDTALSYSSHPSVSCAQFSKRLSSYFSFKQLPPECGKTLSLHLPEILQGAWAIETKTTRPTIFQTSLH
jgi:hypothetical protein